MIFGGNLLKKHKVHKPDNHLIKENYFLLMLILHLLKILYGLKKPLDALII